MQHRTVTASLALVLGLGAAEAGAATVELPLGGLKSGAFIENYFNGGNDSVPSDGTGPALGITFSANATAQSESGAGKFEHNPSGLSQVLYFGASSSTAAIMNDGFGFNDLSFNYSYSNNTGAAGFAYLYSGFNGTGTLLDTISLTPATSNITACTSRLDAYCTWQAVSSGTISGIAKSVVFSGLVGGAGTTTTTPTSLTEFDGVTLTPAPLPAAAWLMLSGVTGLFGFARRRRRAAA